MTPGGEAPRVVMHVGVHKTGSTLIQHHIRANAEVLRAKGVFATNLRAGRYMLKLRNKLRRAQKAGRDGPAIDALDPPSRQVIAAARDIGAHTILVSDENILGQPFHWQLLSGADKASLYPHAEACLRLATHGFEGLPLTLIIYTRQQHKLLVSHYSEALRTLRVDDSLEAFVRAIDLERLNFADLIAAMRRAAPHADIRIAPFETIHDGAPAFLGDFFAHVGLARSDLTIEDAPVRPKVSREAAEKLVAVAQKFAAGGRPQVLKRQAQRIREAKIEGATPLTLSPETDAYLRQRYADDISYRPTATG